MERYEIKTWVDYLFGWYHIFQLAKEVIHMIKF